MGENFAERGPVATEGDILVNTQKKNLRNHGGYRCGWLYVKPKMSTENTQKNAKQRLCTENQNNIKMET